MSALSFLVGLPTGNTVYTPEGIEDIAYAHDWVPLGWLALFETGDVRMVSGAASEDQTPCPTLLTRKDLALSSFRRRLNIYSDVISTDLLDAFRALESVVVNSSSEYLQVILTDIDVFLSEPEETTELLRDWIGAMDTTLADRWSGPLSSVQATVGKNLREIHFPYPDLVRAAISGYPQSQE
jgi:hypothetical protein